MATLRGRPSAPVTETVPPELTDDAHPLWADDAAYVDYMKAHGWPMDARDRLRLLDPEGRSAGSPAVARRRRAVCGWAVEVGVTSERGRTWPDTARLEAMGLL
jgi:hypothetical protein